MTKITTTDLADFGTRELALLTTLMEALIDQGLPAGFYDDEVVPMLNLQSGNVFLTNSEYQVAMLNGDTLEVFYSSPYEGLEGFYDDLEAQYEHMHEEDKEWFASIAADLDRPLPNEKE